MKKYKRDIITIVEVALLILLTLKVSSLSSLDNYFITYSFLIGALLISIYTLYSNIRYKLGYDKDIIRYQTEGDTLSKYNALGTGIAALFISVGCFIWIPSSKEWATYGVVVGFLYFAHWLLFVPSGKIKRADEQLVVSGISSKLPLNSLQLIEIKTNQITFTDCHGETVKQDSLNLDPDTANAIEKFLLASVPSEGIVINNLRVNSFN